MALSPLFNPLGRIEKISIESIEPSQTEHPGQNQIQKHGNRTSGFSLEAIIEDIFI